MPLPVTVCCFRKILIVFTFLVPAYLLVPEKRPLNRCVYYMYLSQCCFKTVAFSMVHCYCSRGLISFVTAFSPCPQIQYTLFTYPWYLPWLPQLFVKFLIIVPYSHGITCDLPLCIRSQIIVTRRCCLWWYYVRYISIIDYHCSLIQLAGGNDVFVFRGMLSVLSVTYCTLFVMPARKLSQSAFVKPLQKIKERVARQPSGQRAGLRHRRARIQIAVMTLSVLGKLFTPIVPLFTKLQNWQQPS